MDRHRETLFATQEKMRVQLYDVNAVTILGTLETFLSNNGPDVIWFLLNKLIHNNMISLFISLNYSIGTHVARPHYFAHIQRIFHRWKVHRLQQTNF